MATSAQIKSAIRSRGASQRDITKQLAGVTEQLQRAEESANLFRLREAEIAKTTGTLSSALELGSTYLEGVALKQELEDSRMDFEQSLPEGVREAGGVKMVRGPKSSLMDVFTGTASLSDYLYGQETYMLGERKLGTKYDVAALGKQAKAMQQGDLLDQFFGGEPLPKSKVSRELGMQQPSIDIKNLYGGLKQEPSMLDNVKEKLQKGTLVKSDGNVIPETIVKKTMSAEDYLKTDPPNAIKEMIESSYPRDEEVPLGISRDVTDYQNEKLVDFLPEFLQPTEKDMLEPIAKDNYIDKDGFIVTKGTFLGRPSTSRRQPPRKKKDTSYRPEGRFGNPQKALSEVDKDLKEIKKLQSLKGVINPTVKKQNLELAKKMKKELQEKIKSIYDSSTGKFIDDEYEKAFAGQLKDMDDMVESGVDLGRFELPFLTKRRKVDISSIQSFIDSISNKNNLASR
jgi:uncharacterized FlaG/YvyC family protein